MVSQNFCLNEMLLSMADKCQNVLHRHWLKGRSDICVPLNGLGAKRVSIGTCSTCVPWKGTGKTRLSL